MDAHSRERILVLVTLALVVTGVLMVYSASAVLAGRWYGDATLFLKRQVLWAVLGLFAMFVASRIPYEFWKNVTFPLLVLTTAGLTAVLTPWLGTEINGSQRWLHLGGLSFQPSEIARVTVVIYLASYLVRRKEHLDDFARGFLPPAVTLGFVMCLILAEPDFGSAVVIGVVGGALMFVGGIRLRHLGAAFVLCVPVLYALVMGAGYRRERLMTFLDPWSDPTDKGFQIIQSFLALGDGGAAGAGLGQGWQKLFFLPYPHTDFIFAVIGEELGLIGTLSILSLFAVVAWCGAGIAFSAATPFGRYLAFGLTLLIVLQAQVNMGVVTGLLPTKGLTLPLLSYGGSSLIVNLAAIGILLSVAKMQRPGGRQPREAADSPWFRRAGRLAGVSSE